MAPASQLLYAILEKLALIEPTVMGGYSPVHPFEDPSRPAQSFQIVLTDQARESIPAALRGSAYFVFMDSL
jgi:hypothetical protein